MVMMFLFIGISTRLKMRMAINGDMATNPLKVEQVIEWGLTKELHLSDSDIGKKCL